MADLITMLAASGGTQGEATDADFQNTVLLLHGDGTNGAQNNTFLDSSTNGFTITRNGNTTQGSFGPFSKPDGSWGNYFNGSAYLSVSNAAMAFGTGEFSVVFWVYRATSDAKYFIGTSNTTGSWAVYSANATSVSVRINSLASDLIAGTITAGAWNKIEVSRTSGTLYLYVNDVLQSSIANTTNFSQSNLGIGSFGQTTTFAFTGYISNVKIIKAGTEVLNTCRSNRFVDTSPSPLTVTPTAALITPFSPFPITTAYSPATNGGSGYFDGTGDYLSIADSATIRFGTGNFTIQAWIYRNASGATHSIAAKGGASTGWVFQVTSTNVLRFTHTTTNIDSTATIPAFVWTHVAVVREGTGSNQTKLYINGVNDGQGTVSTDFTQTEQLKIGADRGNANLINGYISGLKYFVGTAETITVPTSPPTGGTALLNFTNGGIFDNTGFNNLETVGNAQIDTTTKKYGTGSMEFDGTGDWLKVPDSPDLKLGTGNFTIEFWVYLASGDTGSNRGLVGKGGASTGFLVSLNTTEKVVFTYAASTITSTGSITTNAWNHIAVVREGTGSNQTKIYIGGTNDGTGTVSTDFTQTEVMYIGANRTAGDPMKGFIDDLRITKGIARYTTTFTPPTAAFPNIGE